MGADSSFPEQIYLEHDLIIINYVSRNYTEISGASDTSDLIIMRFITSFNFTFDEEKDSTTKISFVKSINNGVMIRFQIQDPQLYNPSFLGLSIVLFKENEITSDGINFQLIFTVQDFNQQIL